MNPQPDTLEKLAALHNQTPARYSRDELRTLCADLGTDNHYLLAEACAGRVSEVIAHV